MKILSVLTASGTDRLGIVDEFTSKLLDYSCNIEESKMAVLGGEFAMIVLVSGEKEQIDRLLRDIASGELVPHIDVTGKVTGPHAEERNGRPYRIESISLDTPGIVHAVTGLLRARNINIDELETETSGAPFTGAPMFHMRITAMLGPEVSVSELRAALSEIASDHDLDIRVAPIVAFPDE
ncbi:MAG: ACT domain-containing protein [Spirochaetia bacterium]